MNERMLKKKKVWQKSGEPLKAGEGWQVVYTGFILILLCFFIMLTSFASLQSSKVTRFARSFSDAVSIFNAGKSLEHGETMIHTQAMVVDKEDKIAMLFQKVKIYGSESGLQDIQLRSTKRGVVMTLADHMLFNSGDAALSDNAHLLLDRISQIIKKLKVHVDIEGHTDNRPINTAVFPSNWELSTARAVNVLRYLIDSTGIDPSQLSAVGLSEYHPVADNGSDENRARNRRVEIIFRPELQ